jgi:prepilin signal peptidase PulO-like enzyme (type II secretory pathway)
VFEILSFIFGASIGSFVQVIATRLHVAPIIASRSKCLSCGETLRVSDLIPVISYFWLRGSCKYCKAKYGISALVIEACFGIVFVLLYEYILKWSASSLEASLWLVYYTLLFVSLGVIALYDYAHTYLPTSFLVSFIVLSLGMMVKNYTETQSMYALYAPVMVALPFFILWLVTLRKGLGFGDVIMFFGVGAFFGVSQGLAVLILSVWIGAIIGVGMYILKKKDTHNRTIPFVPFIVVSFIVVLFTDIDIYSIAQMFS